MKIAFDIGGVISKYPEKMMDMIITLQIGGADVYIVTDMPKLAADRLLAENGFLGIIGSDKVHSANWALHQDQCKAILCRELDIDILIDDRPDYCAEADFIGFVISPRPSLPYISATWNDSSKQPHDGRTCNCDPELRARKSPHVCIYEPCLYDDFHKEGQTHGQYHGWK